MSTMITSEKIDQLVISLSAFHAEVQTPKRNKKADAGKYEYWYADLASLLEHCKPAMQKAGLVFVSAGLVSRLYHTSGQFIEAAFPFNLDGLPPQQIGIALSYGRRYCLQELLGICAEEDDDAQSIPDKPKNAAGTTQAPKKDPATAPAPKNAPAKPAAAPIPSYGTEPPLPAGIKRLDVEAALPDATGEAQDAGSETANEWRDAEELRFVGYAQPKTLSNGAVKMGIRARFAKDGTEGWVDSWDPLKHKDIQDAILKAKKDKKDGIDVYAILEREAKKDGNGEWIKVKDWMPA